MPSHENIRSGLKRLHLASALLGKYSSIRSCINLPCFANTAGVWMHMTVDDIDEMHRNSAVQSGSNGIWDMTVDDMAKCIGSVRSGSVGRLWNLRKLGNTRG